MSSSTVGKDEKRQSAASSSIKGRVECPSASVSTAKTGVARLSVISNTILVLFKILIGVFTGSVSIIAEGIHSGIDLIAAVIAFFAVRIADVPPDESHAYGHGKYENISGTVEALLIILAAIYIGYEAVMKMIHGGELVQLGLGMLIMFISTVMNWFVSGQLFKVAKQTDSIALEADGHHLRLDVYTSLGVFIGLIFVQITHLVIIDQILAFVVALWIGWVGIDISRKAVGPLLDLQLPQPEVDRITCIIDSHENVLGYHKLRTRKSGANRHVDVHLLVPKSMSIIEAHDLAEDVEDRIRAEFDNVSVVTHVEPAEV